MVERRTWVNIAVRPCLHSFLSHNKHHPFENKVWEIYIFTKRCIRSLLKSSLSVDYVPVYICIRVVYNTKSLYCNHKIWQLVKCSLVSRLRYLSSTHDFDNYDQTTQFSFSLYCLTNFNLASLCRFNRREVFFGLCDFRPFLSISLLIVYLLTLHPDECKSFCCSSCITIGF